MHRSSRFLAPLAVLLLIGAGCGSAPAGNQTAVANTDLSAQDLIASTQLEDVVTSPNGNTAPDTNTAPATDASQPLVINFTYHKDQPYSPQTILVAKGQHVVVHVTSDVADTVDLHVYNVSVDATANQQATLEFDATQTGRFILDLKHLTQTLGIFEIYTS